MLQQCITGLTQFSHLGCCDGMINTMCDMSACEEECVLHADADQYESRFCRLHSQGTFTLEATSRHLSDIQATPIICLCQGAFPLPCICLDLALHQVEQKV